MNKVTLPKMASAPGILTRLAHAIGAPEPAVSLLVSILIGFPIALVHRYTLYGRKPLYQHIFFIACGLSLGYWNYGHNVLHSAAALCGTYFILALVGSTFASVLLIFVFNMVYLMYGYYTTSTEDYDIKWTMPQCVLTLRLIGLAFNIWDGQKPEKELSEAQKQLALKEAPSFLEVAAYTYFPGSFLVGPQFSMMRYLNYVNGRLLQETGESSKLPDCVIPGLIRAIVGFTYVIFYQIGSTYIPDHYLLEPEFEEQYFIKRLLIVGFWGHILLYKYISCWLISEAICTTFGLTYNGKDEEGRLLWDGCENVKLLTFEKATRFHHYIISFNINTNNWCAEYIYKRLRFLGSRSISQATTLLFLAVWHGFHSGYYHCFMMEFVIMYAERDFIALLDGNKKIRTLFENHRELRILSWIFGKFISGVFMGYCLISFGFLSLYRYNQVYASVYYIGHIIFFSYPIVGIFLGKLLREKKID